LDRLACEAQLSRECIKYQIQEEVVRTLKEMIGNQQKVRFSFYREGQLWYEAECGFRFPVPIEDAGTATFLAEDRAILFMRYPETNDRIGRSASRSRLIQGNLGGVARK
jgi:hypothetical protein